MIVRYENVSIFFGVQYYKHNHCKLMPFVKYQHKQARENTEMEPSLTRYSSKAFQYYSVYRDQAQPNLIH